MYIGTDTKRYLSVSAIRQRCLAQYDINFGDADIVANISRYIGCPAWRLHHVCAFGILSAQNGVESASIAIRMLCLILLPVFVHRLAARDHI